ncbi:hypothetical protein [Azoarcus olearius]|uniref:Conserved hypothetical membrane protein n=1 Tax=Azoarcus sp. (strain BH72) TaxID=418699 RepID=A1K2A2_AZOSB|nr:hypothetical protein [Azoarcus olearius]CAL92957.1 conserved hypothetical membrane protein [Azoarcus olearius]
MLAGDPLLLRARDAGHGRDQDDCIESPYAVTFPFRPRMLEVLLILAQALLEFLFHTVLYGAGWLMLRALTLGRYPPPRPIEHNHDLVALLPLVTVLVTIAFAYA